MRIEIDLKGNIKSGDITKSPRKDVWNKIKEKKLASMTAGSIATIAWDMIDTTIMSNIGSMTNDATIQNKVDNVISVLDRGKKLLNAGFIGSAAGVPGMVVAVASEVATQIVQGYQANTDWKIQSLENKLKSIIELEALGYTKVDFNR